MTWPSSWSPRPRRRRTQPRPSWSHRLRDEVLPAATRGHDVETMLTGATAYQADISAGLPRQMVLFVSAVIGLSILVLTIVFRSVLVPAEGGAAQPDQHRGGVRRHRGRLPVGLGRRPDRPRGDRADQPAGADPDVRHPVRALDGLRGVPAQPGARAVPQAPRPAARGGRGRRLHGPRHHQRGADHDQRVRRLRAQHRRHGQALRRRPRRGGAAGRHAGPDGPGAGGDEPARAPGLVAAAAAGPDPAEDRPRGHRPPRRSRRGARPGTRGASSTAPR